MVAQLHTKGQLKIFETIGVLIVFFLLLIISFVFYINYQKAQFRIEREQKAVLSSTEIASKSFLLPELDCSVLGVKIPNCYDKNKLKAFTSLINNNAFRSYYFQLFGLSTINITDLYIPTETYVLYDFKPLGKEPKKNVFRTTVCLQEPITRTCGFGIVEVTTYVERQ